MGNTVLAGYKIQQQNTASGGPGLQWRIYDATSRELKTNVSLWILKKEELPPKPVGVQIMEAFKRDALSLTKYRHPNILRVSKSLMEDKTAIALETEPVFASLANLMGDHTNIGFPTDKLKKYALEPLEVKMGILQICAAVEFLHNSAKVLHLNISPENIFLTKDGWKLGGFHFLTPQNKVVKPDGLTLPNVDYSAPELVNDHTTITPAADMFSLAIMLYHLCTNKKLIDTTKSHSPKEKANAFSRQYTSVLPFREKTWDLLPSALKGVIDLMLEEAPARRPVIQTFLDCNYFKDVLIRTLSYILNIAEKTEQSKAQFYHTLPSAIPQFSKKLLQDKVLPVLLMELRSVVLIPFLLPNLFLIATQVGNPCFTEVMFPVLSKVMQLQNPFQVPLLFLQNIEFLIKNSSPENVANHVLPMIFRSFSHERMEVVMAVLQVAPNFAPHISYHDVKESILPRLQNLCLNPALHAMVRIKALQCHCIFIPHISRDDIVDCIIPTLQRCAANSTPAIRMAIVGVCDSASTKAGEVITCCKLLPFILPLLVDKQMTPKQFQTILAIMKNMLSMVETIRQKEVTEQQSRDKDSPYVESESMLGPPTLPSLSPVAAGLPTLSPQPGSFPPVQVPDNKEILEKLAQKTKENQDSNVLNISIPQKNPSAFPALGQVKNTGPMDFSKLKLPDDFPEIQEPKPTPPKPAETSLLGPAVGSSTFAPLGFTDLLPSVPTSSAAPAPVSALPASDFGSLSFDWFNAPPTQSQDFGSSSSVTPVAPTPLLAPIQSPAPAAVAPKPISFDFDAPSPTKPSAPGVGALSFDFDAPSPSPPVRTTPSTMKNSGISFDFDAPSPSKPSTAGISFDFDSPAPIKPPVAPVPIGGYGSSSISSFEMPKPVSSSPSMPLSFGFEAPLAPASAPEQQASFASFPSFPPVQQTSTMPMFGMPTPEPTSSFPSFLAPIPSSSSPMFGSPTLTPSTPHTTTNKSKSFDFDDFEEFGSPPVPQKVFSQPHQNLADDDW